MTTQPPLPYRSRLTTLRKHLAAAPADGLLVTGPQDQYYLTGAVLEDSAVLVTGRAVVIITDGRFAEQVRQQAGWAQAVIRVDGLMDICSRVVRDAGGIRRLGVQGERLAVDDFQTLVRKLRGVRVVSTRGLVGRGRIIKDEHELAALRKAIAAAEAGFLATCKRIKPGLREREVAAELEYQMRLAGAAASAFEPIVAVGQRGSLPHARAGETRLRPGQPVLIDWGARVGGYNSDLTRVVRVGAKLPPKIAEIYPIVADAQLAGIAAVRAGATCREVDAAARKVIADAGYGKEFTHGLGHGLGLDIHEPPRLSSRSNETLAARMVVTVEPGIYLPGIGGVRIEDDVLVTKTGRQALTHLPRALSY